MNLPADLQAVTVRTSTSGTPNTEVITQLLAAPGAAVRYRLYGLVLVGTQSNTGPVLVYLTSNNVQPLIGGTSYPAVGPGSWPWIHGGLALATNASVDRRDRSTVATQGYFMTVYYTIEQV